MDDHAHFGQRLKALRIERGLSQATLAAGGISTAYLSRLESGTRQPTERVVSFLAKRLGVPASVFDMTGPMQAAQPLAKVLAMVLSAVDRADVAERLARAVREDETEDPALRWQALWQLALIRSDQGRNDDEYALLTELLALDDRLDAPELRVRALTRLSRCARGRGDNTKARDHALEAYGLAGQLPVADQAAVLQALVSAEAESGRLAEARAHADELRTLTAQIGAGLRLEALWASATVCVRQADYPAAQELLERAIEEADGCDDLRLWIRLRLAVASLNLQVTPPRTDRTRAQLDEVAPIVRVAGSELFAQQLLTLRAQLAFQEGRIEDAAALCESLREPDLVLSFRDRIRFQALCAQVQIASGDQETGISSLRQLAQQAEEALNVELAAEIWRTLAQSLSDAYGGTGRTRSRQAPRDRTRSRRAGG